MAKTALNKGETDLAKGVGNPIIRKGSLKDIKGQKTARVLGDHQVLVEVEMLTNVGNLQKGSRHMVGKVLAYQLCSGHNLDDHGSNDLPVRAKMVDPELSNKLEEHIKEKYPQYQTPAKK